MNTPKYDTIHFSALPQFPRYLDQVSKEQLSAQSHNEFTYGYLWRFYVLSNVRGQCMAVDHSFHDFCAFYMACFVCSHILAQTSFGPSEMHELLKNFLFGSWLSQCNLCSRWDHEWDSFCMWEWIKKFQPSTGAQGIKRLALALDGCIYKLIELRVNI